MALTTEQKTKVRQSIEAGAKKRGNEMRSRMEFEEKRDALAYKLMEAAQALRAEAKAKGQPDPGILAWAEAQAAADAELSKPKKPAKPAIEQPAVTPAAESKSNSK